MCWEEGASQLRRECRQLMEGYANYLELQGARVLDIGTAGDPPPGENFQWFGEGNTYETLDIHKEYNPTHVGDICNPPFSENSFDLVILSNTLEHIFDIEGAIRGVSKITNKWAIIDTPWMYPYHPGEGFDDYWRISKSAFDKLLPKFGLHVELGFQTSLLTSVLCKKV